MIVEHTGSIPRSVICIQAGQGGRSSEIPLHIEWDVTFICQLYGFLPLWNRYLSWNIQVIPLLFPRQHIDVGFTLLKISEARYKFLALVHRQQRMAVRFSFLMLGGIRSSSCQHRADVSPMDKHDIRPTSGTRRSDIGEHLDEYASQVV